MKRPDEIEVFKIDINLSEYAASLGYLKDRKKSSRNCCVMKRGQGDKIIVGKGNEGHWIYYTIGNDQDSGSINGYHEQLIETAKAQLKGNERFFSMAYALLGNRFEAILSEAKGNALEGQPGRSPTGVLIWRLIQAVKDLPCVK